MTTVRFPAALRKLTGGRLSVSTQASTVRELVEDLERQFPGIKARLCEGDRLRPGIAVAIDSRISATGLATPIPSDAEVQFVPSVAGG